ncbi:hypothetical protein [Candidatus Uabimicrobium sp. HlEnr_7]|uniref:hypothetical protein n=1 Tax=Candidatus Uabimicrobium helgolandensis TaxID=3095367 RepID=UPI0035572327
MKYFQQTESVIGLIHKLNQQNRNITFFIYVMTFSRNVEEFDVFSTELHEKLRTCRFYIESTENGDHCIFGGNHYFVNSVEIQKFVNIEAPQKGSAHLSFFINTIAPQCPKCHSMQHLRKKLVMLNPARGERVGSIFANLSIDSVVESELIGSSQQFTEGVYCTKCEIAFVPDNKLNRFVIRDS